MLKEVSKSIIENDLFGFSYFYGDIQVRGFWGSLLLDTSRSTTLIKLEK